MKHLITVYVDGLRYEVLYARSVIIHVYTYPTEADTPTLVDFRFLDERTQDAIINTINENV